MISSQIKTLVKIALVTGLAMAAYQASDILLLYKYFRFEYYLLFAVISALAVGFMIAKLNTQTHTTEGAANPCEKLTPKEISILLLIVDGKTNKEIASLNFVEVSTVKTHINNIYSKLGVCNRREAINMCSTIIAGYKSTLFPPPVI